MEFVDNTDTTGFPMLWDPSGQTWQGLGIFGQPAYAIIGPDGNLGTTGYGGFDADFVIANAEAYAALAERRG